VIKLISIKSGKTTTYRKTWKDETRQDMLPSVNPNHKPTGRRVKGKLKRHWKGDLEAGTGDVIN
jgi:hypothetical protein